METFNHTPVAPSDAPDHFIAAVVALSTAAETQETSARTCYDSLKIDTPSDLADVVDSIVARAWCTTPGMVRLARAYASDRDALSRLIESGLAEKHPALLALGAQYSHFKHHNPDSVEPARPDHV